MQRLVQRFGRGLFHVQPVFGRWRLRSCAELAHVGCCSPWPLSVTSYRPSDRSMNPDFLRSQELGLQKLLRAPPLVQAEQRRPPGRHRGSGSRRRRCGLYFVLVVLGSFTPRLHGWLLREVSQQQQRRCLLCARPPRPMWVLACMLLLWHERRLRLPLLRHRSRMVRHYCCSLSPVSSQTESLRDREIERKEAALRFKGFQVLRPHTCVAFYLGRFSPRQTHGAPTP